MVLIFHNSIWNLHLQHFVSNAKTIEFNRGLVIFENDLIHLYSSPTWYFYITVNNSR